MIIGQKFTDLMVKDFQKVNKEANQNGLMARITEVKDIEIGRLISFYLVRKLDA